jgi:hypothetical protein
MPINNLLEFEYTNQQSRPHGGIIMFWNQTTERQLMANRENAQKSCGPVSDTGKAKTATNSRKHGLTGRFTVMPGENQEAFDDLFEQFVRDEKPVGSVELELVRKMAEHTWLRERAARCQEACFLVMPQTPEQAKNDEAEVRVRPELERYLRYQSHHDRAYQRAAAELLKRQKERRLAEIGFVSQKRAERQEERLDAAENRKIETHKYAVAILQKRVEREEQKTLAATASPQAIDAVVRVQSSSSKPFESVESHSASPKSGDALLAA